MVEETNTDEISLKDLILKISEWGRFFLSKWKWILGVGIIGSLIGLYIAIQSIPVYTAELVFASEEKGGTNPYAGIASQFGLDLGTGGGSAFAGDNILELIKSRMLIEKTLLTPIIINDTEQLLINRYIRYNMLDVSWGSNPKLKGITFIKNESREQFGIKKDSILNAMQSTIKKSIEAGRSDKKLSILSVKFKSTDELYAKYFVENLVKNVAEFYTETKTKKTKKNILLMEERVDSVKIELDKEILGAAVTKDQNMNPIRSQSSIQTVKKQMNVQILTSLYGELVKNLEASKFMLMREEPLFLIIDRPILPLEKKKTSRLVGGVMGGIIGIFLTVLFLGAMKLRRSIMA